MDRFFGSEGQACFIIEEHPLTRDYQLCESFSIFRASEKPEAPIIFKGWSTDVGYDGWFLHEEGKGNAVNMRELSRGWKDFQRRVDG